MSEPLIAECNALLMEQGINPASTIEYDINGEVHTLSLQEIIETYMLSSDESKRVFVTALKKAMQTDNMGIQKFFEGMGQLLLMSHLSEKTL